MPPFCEKASFALWGRNFTFSFLYEAERLHEILSYCWMFLMMAVYRPAASFHKPSCRGPLTSGHVAREDESAKVLYGPSGKRIAHPDRSTFLIVHRVKRLCLKEPLK
jgi:hypothetical protein